MPIFSPELMNEMVQRELQKERLTQQVMPHTKSEQPTPNNRLANLMGTQLFDAITTDMFLSGKHASEANPVGKLLVKNPAVMYGTKAGAGLLLNWLANKIEKSGHPKVADGFEKAATGVAGMIGLNNLGLVRKGSRPRTLSVSSHTTGTVEPVPQPPTAVAGATKSPR